MVKFSSVVAQFSDAQICNRNRSGSVLTRNLNAVLYTAACHYLTNSSLFDIFTQIPYNNHPYISLLSSKDIYTKMGCPQSKNTYCILSELHTVFWLPLVCEVFLSVNQLTQAGLFHRICECCVFISLSTCCVTFSTSCCIKPATV